MRARKAFGFAAKGGTSRGNVGVGRGKVRKNGSDKCGSERVSDTVEEVDWKVGRMAPKASLQRGQIACCVLFSIEFATSALLVARMRFRLQGRTTLRCSKTVNKPKKK